MNSALPWIMFVIGTVYASALTHVIYRYGYGFKIEDHDPVRPQFVSNLIIGSVASCLVGVILTLV